MQTTWPSKQDVDATLAGVEIATIEDIRRRSQELQRQVNAVAAQIRNERLERLAKPVIGWQCVVNAVAIELLFSALLGWVMWLAWRAW